MPRTTFPTRAPHLRPNPTIPKPARLPAPILDEELQKIERRMEQTERRVRETGRPTPKTELQDSRQRLKKLIIKLEREIASEKLDERDMYNAITNLERAKETLHMLPKAAGVVAVRVAARWAATHKCEIHGCENPGVTTRHPLLVCAKHGEEIVRAQRKAKYNPEGLTESQKDLLDQLKAAK